MKVSIRHGHGIPKNEDILVPYGFGWDERERQYGEGKGGKTLYIKDLESGEVKEITDGLLKKEFLNYIFPVVTDENNTSESAQIDFENGETFYTKSAKAAFFGLTAGLVSKTENIVDENGTVMGKRVYIDHTSIDTRSNEYKLSAEGQAGETVRTIIFDSIDPKYVAQMKNNIEQKALYTVDNREQLVALINRLNEEKKLENGVQFIVKNDDTALDPEHIAPDSSSEFVISDESPEAQTEETTENGDTDLVDGKILAGPATNLDTWLYVVSRHNDDITESQDEETRVDDPPKNCRSLYIIHKQMLFHYLTFLQ